MLSAVPCLPLWPNLAACWQPSPKDNALATGHDRNELRPPPPEYHDGAPPSRACPPSISQTAARNHLQNLERQLSCTVSLDVFQQPMRLNCGHRFEASVACRLLKDGRVCPLCRECLVSASPDVSGRGAAQAFQRAFPDGIEAASDDAIAAFTPQLPKLSPGLQEFAPPWTLDPSLWRQAKERLLVHLAAAAATKLRGANAGSPRFVLADLAVTRRTGAGVAPYAEFLCRESFRGELRQGLAQQLSASMGYAVRVELRYAPLICDRAVVGGCYQVVATIPLSAMEERAFAYYVPKIVTQVEASVRRGKPDTYATVTRHITAHLGEGNAGRLTRFPALFRRKEFCQDLQKRLDEALLQVTGRRVCSEILSRKVAASRSAYQYRVVFYRPA